jgi:hypothetical protein
MSRPAYANGAVAVLAFFAVALAVRWAILTFTGVAK